MNEGDLITLLNVFTAYVKKGESKRWCTEHFLNHRALKRASEIRTRMEKLLVKFDVPLVSSEGNVIMFVIMSMQTCSLI